jgi:hypothetical protein
LLLSSHLRRYVYVTEPETKVVVGSGFWSVGLESGNVVVAPSDLSDLSADSSIIVAPEDLLLADPEVSLEDTAESLDADVDAP